MQEVTDPFAPNQVLCGELKPFDGEIIGVAVRCRSTISSKAYVDTVDSLGLRLEDF